MLNLFWFVLLVLRVILPVRCFGRNLLVIFLVIIMLWLFFNGFVWFCQCLIVMFIGFVLICPGLRLRCRVVMSVLIGFFQFHFSFILILTDHCQLCFVLFMYFFSRFQSIFQLRKVEPAILEAVHQHHWKMNIYLIVLSFVFSVHFSDPPSLVHSMIFSSFTIISAILQFL